MLHITMILNVEHIVNEEILALLIGPNEIIVL